MNNTRRKAFSQIIVESLLIIFSVMLALFLNEWRNGVSEKKRTAILLSNIKKEIQVNQAFVKELSVYHESVLNNLKEIVNTDKIQGAFFKNGIFEIQPIAPNGIIQNSIKDIAWEVAKRENITSRLPFELTNELFELYDQQEIVVETIDRIITLLASREIQQEDIILESLKVFGTDLNEAIGQEKNLLNKYEKMEIFIQEN